MVPLGRAGRGCTGRGVLGDGSTAGIEVECLASMESNAARRNLSAVVFEDRLLGLVTASLVVGWMAVVRCNRAEVAVRRGVAVGRGEEEVVGLHGTTLGRVEVPLRGACIVS